MYGISRQIKSQFSVFLTPSLGTIQPALKNMERFNLVSAQKLMSSGGRPSICYSITKQGEKELYDELLSSLTENPIQFLVTARIRLCCSEILSKDDYIKLIQILKRKTEVLLSNTIKLIDSNKIPDDSSIIFDNLACEYKNFLSLLEGLEHACNH